MKKFLDQLLTVFSLLFILSSPVIGVKIYEATSNLREALGLALAFMLAGIISSFFTKTWEKINEGFIEQVLIDLKLIKSKYHEKYIDYLQDSFRNLDLKGISTDYYNIKLEDVYQELDFKRNKLSQTSIAPFGSTISKSKGKPESLKEILIAEKGNLEKGNGHRIVIVSRPGSGKSTLLKYIALMLTDRQSLYRKQKLLKKLPLFISAKKIDEKLAKSLIDIEDLKLFNVIDRPSFDEAEEKLADIFFSSELKKGHCLVMLDGLDEIGNFTIRQQIAEWFERQINSNKKNDYILTSRLFGYSDNTLSNVKTILEICPFTNTQIKNFLLAWFLVNKEHDFRNKALDLCERIINQANNDIILLARNPLLLTLIAIVDSESGRKLPKDRAELYKEICRVFLKDRKKAERVKDEFENIDKQSILEPIAYKMMCETTRLIQEKIALSIINNEVNISEQTIEPKSLLENISRCGIFYLERTDGYTFAHLTIQEYLASRYIIENELEEELIKNIKDTYWYETIVLVAAQIDATKIIEAILNVKPFNSYLRSLAIECGEVAHNIDSELKEKLDNLKNEFLIYEESR